MSEQHPPAHQPVHHQEGEVRIQQWIAVMFLSLMGTLLGIAVTYIATTEAADLDRSQDKISAKYRENNDTRMGRGTIKMQSNETRVTAVETLTASLVADMETLAELRKQDLEARNRDHDLMIKIAAKVGVE